MGICSMGAIATQANATPSGGVSIISTSLVGDGCPGGTARVELAPDASAFSVLYDQFIVQAGGPTPVSVKNCRIVVELQKPHDEMFQIDGVDFRGFIQLDQGVRARQAVRTKSAGGGGMSGHDRDFGVEHWVGPITENYLISTSPRFTGGAVDCKENNRARIVIASQAAVRNAKNDRSGLLQVDSADGRLEQRYRLSWTKCLGGKPGRRGRGRP